MCFLSGDEAAEIAPKTLDALRTPLEQGTITLGRSGRQATYPARFQLVMAANPCPCGMSLTPGAECRCAPMSVIRYRQRLSGPILDRVDIHQTLHPVRRSLLDRVEPSESSATVLARVVEARERQARRLAETPWRLNADVRGPYLRACLPRAGGAELVDAAVSRGHLSARGVDKVLRLARDHKSQIRPGVCNDSASAVRGTSRAPGRTPYAKRIRDQRAADQSSAGP